jgi:hypothetical protein
MVLANWLNIPPFRLTNVIIGPLHAYDGNGYLIFVSSVMASLKVTPLILTKKSIP